jgi:hypothetical protein
MAQLMDRTILVRFDGRSEELSAAMFHLASNVSNSQIKRATASHFDLPQSYLDGYSVVHNSTAIIVCPEAIYDSLVYHRKRAE